MPNEHPKDPLHGVTLEMIITRLVEQFGWDEAFDSLVRDLEVAKSAADGR